MAEIYKDVNTGSEQISAPGTNNVKYIDNSDPTVIQEITGEIKPLERAMRNALKREGVAADSMSYENVIIAFYNRFVKSDTEKELPMTYISEHPLVDVKLSEFESQDHLAVDAAVTGVKAVVTSVKSVLSGIKNKAQLKKAKKLVAEGKYDQLTDHYKVLLEADNPDWDAALTKTEAAIATDVIKVEEKLEAKEEAEATVTESKLKKTIIYVVIGIGIVLVVWYIFMKKK
jgi:hypothetical protein